MKTGRIHNLGGLGRTLLGALALIVLASLSAPQAAMAATAAGTTISNTVTVTWTGGSDSDTVTFAVLLQETVPSLVFVSSNPADLTNGVGEGQAVTINYTLTSQANGLDNYTLAVASTNAGVGAPGAGPTINGGTLSVDLGGSMALQNVSNNTQILIPGLAANHGLGNGDTVIINGTPYTISGVPVEAGGNTTITIDTPVTIGAGTPIYERVSFAVTLTTGTGAGTHTVDSDAYVTGNSALIDTDSRVITVTPASLSVAKSVNTDGTPQPGETITYTIDVTNTTSSPAANVIITDPIPAFTFLAGNVVNGGCTDEYSIDNGAIFGAAPADLSTVTDLRFDCGTLAGSGSIQVEFDVTIE